MHSPAFLITIDTEGDNLWSRPRDITTRNASCLPRFQQLCEKHSLRPTYLCDWEMARSPVFREFGLEILRNRNGEIGMHLHAWNSPPLESLTDDDFKHMPYLTEYPTPQIREKVKVLSDELESTFSTKMYSHRSGRWGINEIYARILTERGYLVDTSVTPHLSWRSHVGNPNGEGGPDYTHFPESAYFVDLDAIGHPGDSTLLEVPVTILRRQWPAPIDAIRQMIRWSFTGRRAMEKFFPLLDWFRPNGRNQAQMLRILDIAIREQWDYVQFVLHSSELMPGGSPTFPTADSIEVLYDDMEIIFSTASRSFEGLTLTEYYHRFRTETSDSRRTR